MEEELILLLKLVCFKITFVNSKVEAILINIVIDKMNSPLDMTHILKANWSDAESDLKKITN